jgi:hypothetical protein
MCEYLYIDFYVHVYAYVYICTYMYINYVGMGLEKNSLKELY